MAGKAIKGGGVGTSKKKGAVKLEPGATSHQPKGRVDRVTYPHQTLPLLRSTNNPTKTTVGYVRTTPPGHQLNQSTDKTSSKETWDKIRSNPNKVGTYPKEGFDHVLGSEDIRQVDGIPIGGRIVELDGPYHTRGNDKQQEQQQSSDGDGGEEGKKYEEYMEPEEEAALQAELAQRRITLAQMEDGGEIQGSNSASAALSQQQNDGREYGASRTPLDAPIGSLREKWRVLPHFLKLRGLMKQHIDSFDHFVSVEMKQIVQVSSTYNRMTNSVWCGDVM